MRLLPPSSLSLLPWLRFDVPKMSFVSSLLSAQAADHAAVVLVPLIREWLDPWVTCLTAAFPHWEDAHAPSVVQFIVLLIRAWRVLDAADAGEGRQQAKETLSRSCTWLLQWQVRWLMDGWGNRAVQISQCQLALITA